MDATIKVVSLLVVFVFDCSLLEILRIFELKLEQFIVFREATDLLREFLLFHSEINHLKLESVDPVFDDLS